MKSASRSLIIGATLAFLCGAAVWTIQKLNPAALFPERWLFEHVFARMFPDQPMLSGAGTHDNPFQLSGLQAARENDLPFLVNTDDDAKKEFDSHPLSASDLAVLLQSLKENGVTQVMLGSTHAWSHPDPFALDALKTQCSGMTPCITSGVVVRGAVATAMPSAFVRASIPASSVVGDIRYWPRVNRVSIDNTYFGDQDTWAGFSLIESEENPPDKAFLVARWDDRIIFSSALLALMVHEKCRPDELRIEAGKFLRFPNGGKVIPIDDYGRITLSPRPLPAPALLAWQLLRPEPAERDTLKNGGTFVQILDQSKDFGEAHSRANQSMHQLLQQLYQSPRIGEPTVLRRLPGYIELLLLATLCLQLATLHTFGLWARLGALLLTAVLLVLAIHPGHSWIPFCPAFVSVAACLFAFRKQPQAQRDVALRETSAPPDVPVMESVEPVAFIPEENAREIIEPPPGKKPAAIKSPEPETAKKAAKKSAGTAKTATKKTSPPPVEAEPLPPSDVPPAKAAPARKRAKKSSTSTKKRGKA